MLKFDLMLPLGSEKVDKQYLIPCLLPSQKVDMYGFEPFISMILIYSSTLEPTYEDFMLVGAIHKLLSQCSKVSGWTVCADNHLSYTQALIEIHDGVRMELKLKKNNSIDVSIWSFRGKLDNGYLSKNDARLLIVRAHTTVGKCMKISGFTWKGEFKMLCPHWSPREEHICLVTVGEDEEVPQDVPFFFSKRKKCTMHGKELESGHFPWIKEDVDSDGKF